MTCLPDVVLQAVCHPPRPTHKVAHSSSSTTRRLRGVADARQRGGCSYSSSSSSCIVTSFSPSGAGKGMGLLGVIDLTTELSGTVLLGVGREMGKFCSEISLTPRASAVAPASASSESPHPAFFFFFFPVLALTVIC
eukprot:CAMPEP_0115865192 /NCGR_PEP_ID=MMETSP0287-20121206/19593_1 /TAXON_ID=412157 /ORGANISM="Chrysochromulina rotalis, Strain UIO044" /LENGTH=136 /DNA_ID=CAMNT_0003319693 /DNA_START=1063 /DNA_END=1473 /DNA_ORIENTATION=-